MIQNIRSWADRSLVLPRTPHIMWVYGFAGCGKSALAQEMAKRYSRQNRLAGDFFFFRGSADRCQLGRLATTIASQVANAIPATVPLIEAAVKANPGLATQGTTSLVAQFDRLVYRPISSIRRKLLLKCLLRGSVIIVLDGLDECEDREEVATFIEQMIDFFDKNPLVPLRVLVTSRVENHIHQRLHSSNQVRLLDLAHQTSNADIAAALDVAFEKGKKNRIIACDESWPPSDLKARLVQHIGGSFIFMTTILKILFSPSHIDGRTPVDRLPLILDMAPNFDDLYRSILDPWKHLPHFQDVLSTVALSLEQLSISQIADVLRLRTVDVVHVLAHLHAIVQVPDDDRTPVILWHSSLQDFLSSIERSGPFFTPPSYHRNLAYWRISSNSAFALEVDCPIALEYSMPFVTGHWGRFVVTLEHHAAAFNEELNEVIKNIRIRFPTRYQIALATHFHTPVTPGT